MLQTAQIIASPKRVKKIPAYLIHEVLDGKPIYYKGYQAVLNKTKQIDEIMGCSTLQATLIQYLLKIIYRNYNDKIYHVLTNEIGNHIDLGNNFSNDIAIFEKTVLTPDKINKRYAAVPPKIVIEVDNEGDVKEITEIGYVYKKTNKLHAFGVECVFWVLTEIESVIIARANQDWQVIDWNKEIELFDGIKVNIGQYLKEEGIEIE